MPPAASLPAAAAQASDRLQVLWIGNALKAQLTAFWKATIDTFPQQDEANHPVSNWLTVIAAIADQMVAGPGGVTFDQLEAAVQAVYRLCWMTQALLNDGLITIVQATAGANSILVQYNANF